MVAMVAIADMVAMVGSHGFHGWRHFPGSCSVSWFLLVVEDDFWQSGNQVLLGKFNPKDLQLSDHLIISFFLRK